MVKLYVCRICGEPYLGGEAPDDCPFCGAPKAYLKPMEGFSELWKTELTEQEKKDLQETLDLEINATAYYEKITNDNEKYSKLNRLFKQFTRVEKEHAELAAKFLNIDLPEIKGEDLKGSIEKDQKVLIVDDLAATGGTCLATCKLVEKLGGKIVECAFIVDLPDIGGTKKLKDAGYNVYAQCEFEGD